MSKNEQLQRTLENICKVTGDCWYEEQAIKNGKPDYLTIDHNTTYGGYRLERITAPVRAGAGPVFISIGDTCARLKYSEFAELLRGIYAGATAEKPVTLNPNETIINNNQRVFMATWSIANHVFCNLDGLNNVISENNLNAGYYTIYHFWNNKPHKATKKLIKDMFAGARIHQTFHY